MRRLPRAIFGLSVFGLVLLGVVFVVGMRRRSDAVLNAGRRATHVMRPLAMRSAGTKGASASVVSHLGRTTGRSYETPVVAVQHDDEFLIALPYGPRTDWLQNVLAAGSARVRMEGDTYDVDRPRVIPLAEASQHFGPKEQRQQRRFGVDSCLLVHRVAS
jgi:deazaflavin-dependent oxidoreductase (nitroreductase family)